MTILQQIRSPRRQLAFGAAGLVAFAAWARTSVHSAPALSATVEIADMTWTEVYAAIQAGHRTVIVPSGGMEANGPHMIIGKHDHLVGWAARRIAMILGSALVAPVVSFVPEGDYDPPTGNQQWPGTIGLPPAVFAAVLEGIARSLKGAGFTTICFIADHGGSVQPQAEVAAKLQAEWRGRGVQVIDVDSYYGETLETNYLKSLGETDETMGQHAGIADTSELLAVYPQGVDLTRVPETPEELQRLGGSGKPRRASFARGDALMMLKVKAAVQQITAAMTRV